MDNAITILGAGGWGTALALLLDGAGRSVRIWSAFPEELDAIAKAGENPVFLPGIPVPDTIRLVADLDEAVAGVATVVFAVPSHGMRSVCEQAARGFPGDAVAVSVAKGIETDSGSRMSGVIRDTLGTERVAVLSGPSHAEEVARGIPTAVVAASPHPSAAAAVQRRFMTERFRVYTSDDVPGVELGGALKNVIAIAAGVCDGIGYGDNTKAALITRGLAELSRLGLALGGRRETFSGLSGMGDLIVTCLSKWSRNRSVGERLGRGESLDEIMGGMKMVAEGVRTALAAHRLAGEHRVEAPIIAKVHEVLYENGDPAAAVGELMTRTPKPEFAPPPG